MIFLRTNKIILINLQEFSVYDNIWIYIWKKNTTDRHLGIIDLF